MYANIYREMAARGRMSAKSLALHLGVTPKTMGSKLSGKTCFTIKEMFLMQELFGGIPLDELFAVSEPDKTA